MISIYLLLDEEKKGKTICCQEEKYIIGVF